MEFPGDLDAFLNDILAPPPISDVTPEDRAFINRILRSIAFESKGIFLVLHPDERMEYMLLNTNRAGAIALLARVMQRTAEFLERDLELTRFRGQVVKLYSSTRTAVA